MILRKLTTVFYVALAVYLTVAGSNFARAATTQPSVEKQADGIIVPINGWLLKVQVIADDIVRIAFAKDATFFSHESLAVVPQPLSGASWDLSQDKTTATVQTKKFKAIVDLASGAVSFFDSSGKPILAEASDGRTLEPAIVQGSRTFHLRQQWQPVAGESLYGLGQQQLGLVNIKGYDLDLWQHNGTVVVPMLVSSSGYGIFWDNPSYTRFGDLRQQLPISADQMIDADGKSGGWTASYFADAEFKKLAGKRVDAAIDIPPPPPPSQDRSSANATAAQRAGNTLIHPDLPPRGDISVRWEGFIQPQQTGEYIFQTYSDGSIRVWIGGQLVIDHWRQDWLPWYDVAKVALEAGKRVAVRVEWIKDQNDQVRLTWKMPTTETATSLWSEVGDGVDYYFVYGPRLDDVIAGYRKLTGPAPMMPLWTFGLWQSRQRYKTQQESLDVVDGFRSRKIPFDNIVQDWFYWKADAWGSHQFDPERFPDPQGWVNAIHDRHAHLMISVWPKFYPGTENFEAMRSRGFLFERNLGEEMRDWVRYVYAFYDAFNPEAGKLFWSQINRELFSKKIDAWWLDATEPDLTRVPTLQGQRSYAHPTALGPGSRVLNAFALVNSRAVYEGQRTAAPDQRVFILTRSGFAGQQRYAAATWSGDTSTTWTAMRKQIAAGIGFCLSGVPYWSMDIGGFSVPEKFATENPKPEDVDEWRELNTRWFEFGTFVPLTRVHGEFPLREMWQFGGEKSPAYQAQLKFDRLRYRLLPYIYSLAGDVTHNSGTMMRGLVMDFPDDTTARDITDEYLFGPALLVSPVTTYKAHSRSVYLPKSSTWYDFWTGKSFAGGQRFDADAPYDAISIHVRAGSIIPFGDEIQYTAEKPAEHITLYVYGGADGAFSLYEDDGVSFGYEKGAFARIPLKWNDETQTLTIGKREGSFPEMLDHRTFDVLLVNDHKPGGFPFTAKPDQTVKYDGEAIEVSLK